MNIKPIKTKADYNAALKEIDSLMAAKRGSPEGDRLDIMVTLVEAFEKKHFRLDLPDPIDAIKFYMDQHAFTPKDLVPLIGKLNRVYEVLNYKRPLSLEMIRRLHKEFGIPAESLIGESRSTSA